MLPSYLAIHCDLDNGVLCQRVQYLWGLGSGHATGQDNAALHSGRRDSLFHVCWDSCGIHIEHSRRLGPRHPV